MENQDLCRPSLHSEDFKPVSELRTEESFEQFIKYEKLCVIHFCSPWVPQCTHMDDVLKDLSRLIEHNKVKFAKLDVNEVPTVSAKFNISAVPVIVIIRNSIEIDRINGANAMTLTNKLENYASEQYDLDRKEQKAATEKRIKSLVNQAPCMLFMKGSPKEPRCGFSKKIVKILDSCNVDYKSYDILQDEEARAQLKIIFSWPTFPQLYLNGKLLGGLDIVEEMKAIGELEETLPKKE